MDYMQQLNEKQREAVMETEGYVRVIAGAGSGMARNHDEKKRFDKCI